MTIHKIHVCSFQSTEVKNSAHMELEGLIRTLQFLSDAGVQLDSLTTDRHGQIAKYMRENHPELAHYFEPWHFSKSKTLTANYYLIYTCSVRSLKRIFASYIS